jgi:biotin carboxyl carrier protein
MSHESSHVVRLDDETFRVEVAGDGSVRVASLDATFHVTPAVDGWQLVSNGTARWRVMVAADGDRRQVFVNGEVYDLQVEAAGRARRVPRGGTDLLTVPMPARVSRILVVVGQAVRRGDVVVTLEAMKMELPLRAPRDGSVRSLTCREGDLVQPGASLLEIS